MTAKRNDRQAKEMELSAQPTCVDTHRPPRGSSTLSTNWPGQFYQQSCDAFIGGIFTARLIVRADLTPAAQQTIFVARLGAQITQALAEVGDTHRGMRRENQSEYVNNGGEAVWILTQA
jgi:hypothetical protein